VRAEVEAQARGNDRDKGRGKDKGKELPPALAAMIDERREAAEAAADAARSAAIVVLPAATWREIQQRAASVGVDAELVADGGELSISVDLAKPDAGAEQAG
jgi:hypothetical protein